MHKNTSAIHCGLQAPILNTMHEKISAGNGHYSMEGKVCPSDSCLTINHNIELMFIKGEISCFLHSIITKLAMIFIFIKML